MRGFLTGAGDAVRSIAWWRRTPGVMALGLVPAAIVNVAGIALFALVMFVVLPGQIDWLTAWADGWAPAWNGILRGAIFFAVGAGLVFLLSVTFTALTLAIGDPFYERIWRAVELRLHGTAPDVPYGFWASAGDAVLLFLRGIVGAILAGVLGLVPIVGTVLGFLVGLAFTGWGLAGELTGRALVHRGIPRRERKRLMRSQRSRSLGFGMVAQLGMMVPLLAIFTMPTLVAGSTQYAADLLAARRSPAPIPPARPAASPAPRDTQLRGETPR